MKADLDYLPSLVEEAEEIPDNVDSISRMYLNDVLGIAKENKVVPERKLEVTTQKYKSCWSSVSEHTQFLVSGLHYGVYKATSTDGIGSEANALYLALVVMSDVHSRRWEVTLQLLLAKVKGECSVENSRCVILYGADLNHLKQVFMGEKQTGLSLKVAEGGVLQLMQHLTQPCL